MNASLGKTRQNHSKSTQCTLPRRPSPNEPLRGAPASAFETPSGTPSWLHGRKPQRQASALSFFAAFSWEALASSHLASSPTSLRMAPKSSLQTARLPKRKAISASARRVCGSRVIQPIFSHKTHCRNRKLRFYFSLKKKTITIDWLDQELIQRERVLRESVEREYQERGCREREREYQE